jgi:DNA mismatch repair protein MutS2
MSAAQRTLEGFAADALDWPRVRELFAAHAASSLGRRALEELQPRTEADAREALARCAELLAYASSEVGFNAAAQNPYDSTCVPPLAGITDPQPILLIARRFTRALDEDEFKVLATFLRALAKLRRWVTARTPELPACARLADAIPDLTKLTTEIDKSLDDRGRVVDEASPALRKMRKDSSALESDITRVVQRISSGGEVRKSLAEGQLGRVHWRGGRPVLAVRARERRHVKGIVHDRSQSGETLFIEPAAVVESGNRLADLRISEAREVSRILTELTRLVFGAEPELHQAIEVAAEFEIGTLSALWAISNDGRVVTDAGGPGMLLRSIRHPILVQKVRAGELESCVPIDLRLGEDFDLIVITGPNTGGKTLALKSAGLAALLVRLGLPVICSEGSRIPFYDGIFADIGDEQEVEQNLSTFASHLVRIRAALATDGSGAGPRTLTLFDELGGGTDPDEGSALGEALLEELLRRGAPALVSTHLGRLKEVAYRHARAENACTEFDLETLAPQYHLLLGIPGESRALAIAKRLGLPSDLLARAAECLEASGASGGEREALFDDLRQSRSRAEELRGQAETKLGEVEDERRHLKVEREAQARQVTLLTKEAQLGIEKRLRDAKSHLAKSRSLLPQMAKAAKHEMQEALDKLEEALVGSSLDDLRTDFLAGLKKGDHVWVPRYRKRCAITRIFKEKKRVSIQVGRAEFEVGFEEISTYDTL